MRIRRRRIPPTIQLPPAWRRHRGKSALAVVVLLVVALDQVRRSPASGADQDRYHNKTARVVYVADGDTFDVDIPDRHQPDTRIRLWGVDTPELAHSGHPAMHFGPEANDFTRDTLLNHDVHIMLSPARSRDKYGRLLAYVYLRQGEPSFNELLIERGFGYADGRFDHPFKDDFVAAEKRARRESRGLWASVTEEGKPAWRQRMDKRSRKSDR